MPLLSPGFFSLLTLICIHLFGNTNKISKWIWHGRFLSFAAGISFAYIFVDLLPALEKGQPALRRTFNFIPYFDRHAYVIALLGVLFYYGLHKQSLKGGVKNYWVSLSGYFLFNFLMGTGLSDSNNPEIQPILIFTIAMGMHYFVRDHNASEFNFELYEKRTRWLLISALILGYIVGFFTTIPDSVESILVSFLAGGVLLNSFKYELPDREELGYGFFIFGSLIYTIVLLSIGK